MGNSGGCKRPLATLSLPVQAALNEHSHHLVDAGLDPGHFRDTSLLGNDFVVQALGDTNAEDDVIGFFRHVAYRSECC
jgi:hypothetical protein